MQDSTVHRLGKVPAELCLVKAPAPRRQLKEAERRFAPVEQHRLAVLPRYLGSVLE